MKKSILFISLLSSFILALIACENTLTTDLNQNKIKKAISKPPLITSPILQINSGGHMAFINNVLFTPDGRYLISASRDKTIRVWDWKKNKTVRFIRGEIGDRDVGKIYTIALSPNGKWLAAGGYFSEDNENKGAIRLYNFQTGKLIRLLKGHNDVVYTLAFSPDNQKLVSGSADKMAIIWDFKRGKLTQKLRFHTKTVSTVAFTVDNHRLVTGSLDYKLALWQVSNGRLLQEMVGHTDEVNTVAVSPLGDFIASGSQDGVIRLWSAKNGHYIDSLYHDYLQKMDPKKYKELLGRADLITQLDFSPDGLSLLASTYFNCSLWNLKNKKNKKYFLHNNLVSSTNFHPNGLMAVSAGGHDNVIKIWDLKTNKTIKTLNGQGKAIYLVSFSTEGKKIAWGGHDYISTPKIEQLKKQLDLPSLNTSFGHPQLLTSKNWLFEKTQFQDWRLDLHKNENISKSKDNIDNTRLDIFYKKEIKNTIKLTNNSNHISYSFSPNGKVIVSAGHFGVLEAYNRQGKKMGDFIGHTDSIRVIAISANGQYLMSGGSDQTLKIWRMDNQELLLTLFTGDKDDWVAWTPQGYYTASPNGDKLVGWHLNRGVDKTADYASAEQLRQHFYRPDIIDATFRLGSAKKAIAQSRNTHLNLNQLLSKGLPPQFNINSPQNNQKVRHLMQDVTFSYDPTYKMDSFEIYVNGKQVISRGRKIVPKLSGQQQITQTLPLTAGKNIIEIIAYNQIGQTKKTLNLILDDPNAIKKGRLFLVSIGVSDYDNNDLDLKYGAKDAIALHDYLKAHYHGTYTEIKSLLLADGYQSPTAPNIQDALDLFAEARVDDTVILFLAGHGVNPGGTDYYFLPKEAKQLSGRWRPSSIIKWQTLQDAITHAQGRRIMLVDTCHAGNAFNNRMVNDADDKNIVVISATSGANVSLEKPELAHGVFTYALLQGLKGKADPYGDKKITLNGLNTWLSRQVSKLTDGFQEPVINIPDSFKDFALLKL